MTVLIAANQYEMATTPKGLRLHIGLFGRRNAGKSSLLERDDAAGGLDRLGDRRHDDRPGREADGTAAARAGAVHRHGRHRRRRARLGDKRVQKTRQVFDRTDVGILVVDAGRWDEFEEGIFRELREREHSGHRRLQ